jgi:hypothetical protein
MQKPHQILISDTQLTAAAPIQWSWERRIPVGVTQKVLDEQFLSAMCSKKQTLRRDVGQTARSNAAEDNGIR